MKKVFFLCGILFVGLFCLFLHKQPRIRFTHHEIHIALHDEVKPYDYIDELSHIDIKNLEIDNHVDAQKLGQYTIEYHYKQRTFTLEVFVDDVTPPQFETINTQILKNQTVNPATLVKDIRDDSQTIVYFLKDYLFNEIKTYKVEIVVEDAYGNKTVKNAYVLVEDKDIQAPIVEGIEPLTILIGEDIHLREGVIVRDNHDTQPILNIDDSLLNLRKTGEYEVKYIVEDHSGNKATYIRKVEVLSQYDNKEPKADGRKTCYLTFDDGPSQNTKAILDILDRYHIKATFFVTGESQEYVHYIKTAHDKGHTIGLHAYDHDYQKIYSSVSQYMKDLNQISELVYKQTGEYTHFIRFPGGSSNMVSKQYNSGIMKRLTHKVIDLGYQYYDWTSLNGDGENIKTVEGLKKKAIESIGNKEDIMFLMHDSGACDNTVKALPDILDYLIKKGYEFYPIDEKSPTFHHTVQN